MVKIFQSKTIKVVVWCYKLNNLFRWPILFYFILFYFISSKTKYYIFLLTNWCFFFYFNEIGFHCSACICANVCMFASYVDYCYCFVFFLKCICIFFKMGKFRKKKKPVFSLFLLICVVSWFFFYFVFVLCW